MMSQAILLLGHGSRHGVAECLHFSRAVQSDHPAQRVYSCFLEFARPTVVEAADRALEAGASCIVLMPLFLFAARHMQEDVAGAMQQVRGLYPHLPLLSARHLNFDRNMLSIIDERLAEATGARPAYDPEKAAVLLIGRGSRRSENNAGVYEVARSLQRQRNLTWVNVCFAGMAHPTVMEGIQQCVNQGAQRVILLPYLLFSGTLTRRVAAVADAAQAQCPSIEILRARHLGGHNALRAMVRERINEAMDPPGASYAQ